MRVSPPRLLTWWRWAFALATAVHLVVLYWPRSVSMGGPAHLDKITHVAVFAAVAVAGLCARLPAAALLAALSLHAIVSEVLQATVLPGRSGDPFDVLADLVGVLLGALAGARLASASWRGERTTTA